MQGVGKNEMLLDVVGWGVSECLGRPIFIFLIKENLVCAMTRNHAESSNINILLRRNLPIDSVSDSEAIP